MVRNVVHRWWIAISIFSMATSFYLIFYNLRHGKPLVNHHPEEESLENLDTIHFRQLLPDQNHRNISTEMLEKNNTNSQDAKCRLPMLDPWHSSVKGLVHDPGKLDCGISHSSFENNTLNVNANDGVSASYNIINRPEGDDFSRSLSETFAIPNQVSKTESMLFTQPGISGCLMHMDSKKCLHPLGGESQPPDGTILVFHSDCCFRRIEFRVREDHSIVHVMSGRCIHVKDSKASLHRDCSTKFNITNGTIHLAQAGKQCLESSSKSLPKNDEHLIMGSSCSQTFGIVSTQGKGFNGSVIIDADFIRVDIKQNGGKPDITEVHMQTAPKPDVLKRTVKPAGIPVNIALIMFDSTSAANFHRQMAKTNDYLKARPTVFMKGNTIVGDGTTAQLCAMLTGIAEEDEPEARRSKPNSKVVDDWRWVFHDYRSHGYATMYSEDSPGAGTFNYRLHGFKNPPTDHYGRYFWIEGQQHKKNSQCAGNDAMHRITMK